jgi:hypothetical protein
MIMIILSNKNSAAYNRKSLFLQEEHNATD